MNVDSWLWSKVIGESSKAINRDVEVGMLVDDWD